VSVAAKWGTGRRANPAGVLNWLPPLIIAAMSFARLGAGPHRVESIVLTAALVIPLLARRRLPVVVFIAIAAAAFVQWIVGLRLGYADVSLLVAFYTLANRATFRLALLGAAALELGCVLALARWSTYVGPSYPLAFILLSGVVIASGALGAYARVRTDYVAELKDRADRAERERDQHAELAAAQERTRIAREMHDSLAHHLTVVVALANGAAAVASETPEQAALVMKDVAKIGQQALADTRRLLAVLRTTSETNRSPQPGLGDIGALIDQVRGAGLPVSYAVAGQPYPLSPPLELTLYRVVQEGLTNSLKHAGANATATVRLEYQPAEVLLTIRDDGVESVPRMTRDQPAVQRSVGQGLRGMHERIAAWSGTLTVGPAAVGDHTGWLIEASIPMPTEPTGPPDPRTADQHVHA
jgi:signal transduction histidine kinase